MNVATCQQHLRLQCEYYFNILFGLAFTAKIIYHDYVKTGKS